MEKIEEAIKRVVQEMGFTEIDFVTEHPAEESHGDYATNVALKLINKGGQRNFLENIRLLLTEIGRNNFEKLQKPLPVGKLTYKVQKVISAKSDIVAIKPRVYAKIRGWWKNMPGHKELTPMHFMLLPLLINQPTRIYRDNQYKKRYHFIFTYKHLGTIVIELLERDEVNEIVTMFYIKERQLKKMEEIFKTQKKTFGAGPASSRYWPSDGSELPAAEFSGLHQKVYSYITKIEEKIQGDILVYEKKQNPRELSAKIVDELQNDEDLNKIISKIEVAGPGFINFWLKEEYLISEAERVVKEGENYGSSDWGKGKTVIVDYSSPNIAKRFSIGHLRSTIIGQAIYNIYKFLGWKVIGDNHLGDWGTQFGKMIVAIKKWSEKPVEKLSIDEMEQLYVKFHKEAEGDPDLNEQARQTFKNLEDGKKQERKMWGQLVKASMQEFQKIYDLLDVVIDVSYGESFYEKIMPEVIQKAKQKKIAVESEGALIVPFPDSKLPPGMLLKKDGATTYFTRDLATIKFRKDKWGPDLVIYEVGAEQSLHFRQVFWAAELLGMGKRNDYVHIPHGLIRLREGKISTRKGKTIKLEEVLNKAVTNAKKFNTDDKTARTVGIGAIKYNDLKKDPRSDYIFDWKEILNLEGNSGPYLQYTYARCKSVLRKSNFDHSTIQPFNHLTINSEEALLLRSFYKFPEVVLEAGKTYSPNLICNYLFDLAQKYNTFYNKHKIIGSEKEELRLLLTASSAQTLKNGLNLLGIKTLERM